VGDQGSILVPLDGSTQAERALPFAVELARAVQRPLLLVRVIRALAPPHIYTAGPKGEPLAAYQELAAANRRSAQAYLERLARAALEQGVLVRQMVVAGDDASVALVDVISHEAVDLVVMSTHGRTGVTRAALGSVADRLVRYGPIPILLLRSETAPCRRKPLERAVLALDGSARAESAIDRCRALLGPALRELVLIRVVPTDASEDAVADAQRYLDEVSIKYTYAGITDGQPETLLTTKVVRGETAERLLALAQAACGLLVIATRGRSGIVRWAHGSVTDRVLRGAHAPLLLIRVP
jgi:nucleotide-binding universal stress UspA family protein